MYAQESTYPLYIIEETEENNRENALIQSSQLSLITEVLSEADPTRASEIPTNEVNPRVLQSLNSLFPEQQFDKQIRKVTQILGPIAQCYSNHEIHDLIIEVQFLCESWLDEYEKKIFNGMTLQEFVHEKGAI